MTTLGDTNVGYFSHVVGGFMPKSSGNLDRQRQRSQALL